MECVSRAADTSDCAAHRHVGTHSEATAMLDATAVLVEAMDAGLAVEPCVYARLQRLACHVETAIFAADYIRNHQQEESTQ